MNSIESFLVDGEHSITRKPHYGETVGEQKTHTFNQIQNGTNVENPIDKYASQWSSTGEHISQLDLRIIPDYRSSLVRFAMLDNLRCWRDIHLHTIE